MVFCCLLSEYRALGELLTASFRWGSVKSAAPFANRGAFQTLGSTPRPDVKVQLWNHALAMFGLMVEIRRPLKGEPASIYYGRFEFYLRRRRRFVD